MVAQGPGGHRPGRSRGAAAHAGGRPPSARDRPTAVVVLGHGPPAQDPGAETSDGRRRCRRPGSAVVERAAMDCPLRSGHDLADGLRRRHPVGGRAGRLRAAFLHLRGLPGARADAAGGQGRPAAAAGRRRGAIAPAAGAGRRRRGWAWPSPPAWSPRSAGGGRAASRARGAAGRGQPRPRTPGPTPAPAAPTPGVAPARRAADRARSRRRTAAPS